MAQTILDQTMARKGMDLILGLMSFGFTLFVGTTAFSRRAKKLIANIDLRRSNKTSHDLNRKLASHPFPIKRFSASIAFGGSANHDSSFGIFNCHSLSFSEWTKHTGQVSS